jgi:hypothetical protein
MQMLDVGISTTVPRLNFAIALAATSLLAFECCVQFSVASGVIIRIAAGAGALIFGLATVVAGFSIVVWAPDFNLGEVPVHHGRLIALRSSVPLVSDVVLVQWQLQVFPGLFVFQRKALLDPAWNASVRAEAKAMIVSYTDGGGQRRSLKVSP